jgi:hypothetical protein
LDSIPLLPGGHIAFNLTDRYPTSAGKRGLVWFTGNLTMGVLGLRFGAQAFTSILPLSPQ